MMTRQQELARMTKRQLAGMHIRGGGLLTVAEYLSWTKDELVTVVLEDEGQHYTGVEHGWAHDALVDTWHCNDPRKAGA